ncbi:putative protein [Pseudoclavibacter triregionum]|nr:putative protein [Pseudoclavibacter triregionum]
MRAMNEYAPMPADAPEDARVRRQPEATPEPTLVELPHGTGRGPFTAVLWDLDGTIADSAPGITSAIAKMLDAFGLPIPSYDELLSYVGPPILDSFKRNGLDDAVELEHAMAMYREIYREQGEGETVPFAGIPEIVTELHTRGMPQSTATSKPEPSATRILEHFGIADDFDFITGATEDETRSDKADVVREALRRLDGAGVDLSNVLMIGDRHYDVTGSAVNGVPSCYVTWGYGIIGEQQGASWVATTPAELRRILGLPEA